MAKIFVFFLILLTCNVFAQDKGVSTEGSCQRRVVADRGQLQMSVQELSKSLKEAKNRASEKLEKFSKAAKKLDLPGLEIETTEAQVYPQYEWEKNKNVFKGYLANFSLRFTSSSFERMGELLDLAVAHDIKNVGQLGNFLSKDLRRKEEKACLEAATKDAKDKAEILAQSLGARLGRVQRIVYSSNPGSSVAPMMKMERASFAAADATSTPAFEAAKHDIEVHVSASFELVN